MSFRPIGVLLAAGILLGPFGPAEAAKSPPKRARAVELFYQSTGAAVDAGTCTEPQGDEAPINCPQLQTRSYEQYVNVGVGDMSALAVGITVKGDEDGDGTAEVVYGAFCGQSEGPIHIQGGVLITFLVGVTPETAAIGCAPGTHGQVEVTLSNIALGQP